MTISFPLDISFHFIIYIFLILYFIQILSTNRNKIKCKFSVTLHEHPLTLNNVKSYKGHVFLLFSEKGIEFMRDYYTI